VEISNDNHVSSQEAQEALGKLLGIVNGMVPKEAYEDEDGWFDKDATCQSMLIAAPGVPTPI
jgi:hypothetical protein